MQHRPIITLVLGFLAIAGATTAPAQTPPAVSAGMTVLDPSGGTVGVVESISGGNAVIATGANSVALPLTSFAMGPKGPVIAMTKAQLDAVAVQAAATMATNLRAQIVPGATIKGSQGTTLGTIKEIDGEFLVLTTAQGDARLSIASVGSDGTGLTIGMTASELEKAVGASQ